jgi:hypothetical protein
MWGGKPGGVSMDPAMWAQCTVPVSLDQKSDSEPATGHQFFSLEHDCAISKYFNPFISPQ